MTAAGDYAQVVQVFEQFFVFFDWQNNSLSFAILNDVFRRRFARFH